MMSTEKTNPGREGKGPKEKVTLAVSVGGEPVKIKAEEDDLLGSIVPEALEKAKVTGRPAEDWLLKDENGVLYDLAKRIGDYGFPSGYVLYLSLGAGEAGV